MPDALCATYVGSSTIDSPPGTAFVGSASSHLTTRAARRWRQERDATNPRHDARRGKSRGQERGTRNTKKFVAQQHAMAAALLRGARELVARPKRAADVNFWQRPAAAKKAAAKIAMERK